MQLRTDLFIKQDEEWRLVILLSSAVFMDNPRFSPLALASPRGCGTVE
jgi:hypothetical protein